MATGSAGRDVSIDVRSMMENHGFEDVSSVYNVSEDFSSVRPTQQHFSSSTPYRRQSQISPRELFPKVYTDPRHFSSLDAHVYEDISPASGYHEAKTDATDGGRPQTPHYEDNPGFSPAPESLGSLGADGDGVFNLSRDVQASSGPTESRTNVAVSATDVLTRLHRTLTLPLKRSPKVFDGRDREKNRSVRVTSKEKGGRDLEEKDPSYATSHGTAVEVQPSTEAEVLVDESIRGGRQDSDRHGRRRKKKDCKHCKNKMNCNPEEKIRLGWNKECIDGGRLADGLPLHANKLDRCRGNVGSEGKVSSRLEPILTLPQGKLPNLCPATRSSCRSKQTGNQSTVYTMSNNESLWSQNPVKPLNYDKNEIQDRLSATTESTAHADSKALITPQKNRTNMKVNSIYSQEQWDAKRTPIFCTDVKDRDHFQRAYSLPSRGQTPSSQNRVNLRRSVRGEPPPRPARLDKHRGGWTLHFARPLHGRGCTKSVVVLIMVILLLLGVGCTALYILFEPQKLQAIQQYLMASAPNATTAICDSCTTVRVRLDDLNNTSNPTSMHLETTTTTTTTTTSTTTRTTVIWSPETTVIPEPDTAPTIEIATTQKSRLYLNTTRYCDDCVLGEVCVALVNDEVPICRTGPDPEDPTGCAGLCVINTQRCHRLDVDAFRCEDLEHHCLEGEWTCSNGLCIPVVKHCDGHMNCYDHSDEFNCDCDLETHFRCGNGTSCLPLERRCDGVINCWDATDEINCTVACPLENEFTCSNGQCIPKMRFCDGLRDCVDGSDEPHGCQGRCNKHEYTCGNGRCITKGLKCNGIDDCGDGTDEKRCRDRPT